METDGKLLEPAAKAVGYSERCDSELPTCDVGGVTYIAELTGSANMCNGCAGEFVDALCGGLDHCFGTMLGDFIWIRKE